MNLKLLISLKFIATILFLGIAAFCYYNTSKNEEAVENVNTIYRQQDKFRELEKVMSPSDSTGIVKLHALMEENRLEIKKQIEIADSIPDFFYSMCLYVCLIAGSAIVSSLDNKIEQEKKTINDNGKML